MSYDQLSNLESGRQGGYTDDPEFQNFQFDLKNKIQILLSSNRKLTNDINALGTKKDTPRLRERLNNLLEKTRQLCQNIGDGIKKLQSWEDLTKQQKYEQTKVSSDFQAALQEFQTIQRKALEKEKASVSAARAAQESEHAGGAGSPGENQGGQQLLQQEQLSQMAPQDEVDFQEALIIEREEEIRNIEQGVGDLNVLFTQVAQIVGEQGQQLDTIADNVENVREDTRQADIENRQAAHYQKAARNKSCCLLLIMAIILTIVLLAIFIG